MFIDDLQRQTSAEREFLLTAPVIGRCLAGMIDRDLYVSFLTQAYHHVRHTVPLLERVRERVPTGWSGFAVSSTITSRRRRVTNNGS